MTNDKKSPNPIDESNSAPTSNTTYDLRKPIDRAMKRMKEIESLDLEEPREELGGTTFDLTKDKIREMVTKTGQVVDLDNRMLFAPDMVLRFDAVNGSSHPIIVEVSGDMIVGRADNVTDYVPDIDLSPHGAYRMGLSRRHAIIHRDNDGLIVKDLGSRNGTFVNGIQVTSGGTQTIKDGDDLRFGNLTLRITFQRKT